MSIAEKVKTDTSESSHHSRLSFGDMARALKHRNFQLFFSGQLISLIGTWMDNVAEGWLVYRLTGSSLLLGVAPFAGLACFLGLAVYIL